MTATDAGATLPSVPKRFSGSSIALHWLMAILLLAVFALIEFRGIFPKGSAPRDLMKSLHFMLGLSVLALVVVRLALRLTSETPPIVPAPAWWQNLLAHGAHLALYGLMIAMPLLGWLYLSAEGKNIPFFGVSLPPLIGQNDELADTFEELHEALGNVFYVVIGLHAAAALAHHYLFRDNTLVRMLPGGRR
jgi:superoxide oxidase